MPQKLMLMVLLVTLFGFSTYAQEHQQRYFGGMHKGNYVWGGAMNLAWNELNEVILKDKLQLRTNTPTALAMLNGFNNPIFTKKDLDEESYYICSGYGQDTVKKINKETKKKFPKKSIADLDVQLSPRDIISYAYFMKEVEYLKRFNKKTVTFNGEDVEGFFAEKEQQFDTVHVLFYRSPAIFILRLQLKQTGEQLILAKGYPMTSPEKVLEEVVKYNSEYAPSLSEDDVFEAPKLHLSVKRDYGELVGLPMLNKGFENYEIAQMFESIVFDMDEKGARVENEAVMVVAETAMLKKERKICKLDAPYWVVMKRKNSQNPYFLLGVQNTVFMKKK